MIFFHPDDHVVVEIADETTGHSHFEGFQVGDQISNPLYSVVEEHTAALGLLILMPLLGILLVRLMRWRAARGSERFQQLLTGYAGQSTARRWATWAILTSALVHLVLAFGHEASIYTVLYLVGAAALFAAARWLALGVVTRWTTLILLGSIVAFWFLGAPPDQLGVVTKVVEMFALALLVVPSEQSKGRFATAGVVVLVVLGGLATWAGAFASAGADGGHHGGGYPEPGTVVPYLGVVAATDAEHDAADEMYARVVESLAKFEDPVVAEQYGYSVLPISGSSHHADNPEFLHDGKVLDPERPETLVYAEGADGPVLLGAMFQMEGLGTPGPRVGGPLTVWHSHENVCISLVPFALVSLLSPYGVCPVGAVNLPATNEMIHAWVLPGVEDGWGHLDDEWLADYLRR